LVCEHFAKGSKGATNLAQSMVKLIDKNPGKLKFVYEDADELWKRIGKVAKHVYHASEVVADTSVRQKIEKFQQDGFGNLRSASRRRSTRSRRIRSCVARPKATSSTCATCT
jgi:formate--tetrahydrofolate ligase